MDNSIKKKVIKKIVDINKAEIKNLTEINPITTEEAIAMKNAGRLSQNQLDEILRILRLKQIPDEPHMMDKMKEKKGNF